jgi:hypothetical protein
MHHNTRIELNVRVGVVRVLLAQQLQASLFNLLRQLEQIFVSDLAGQVT